MAFQLCVKEAILVHKHKPTLNIQKEAYETLYLTQIGFKHSKYVQNAYKFDNNFISVFKYRKVVLALLMLFKNSNLFSLNI